VKLLGDESRDALEEATNYAAILLTFGRFEEAKSVLRKRIPVAQRLLGASDEFMFKMRGCYADALYSDPDATLSELRDAVTRFEDLARDARRVLGSAHPFVAGAIGKSLKAARAKLRARETSRETPSEAV
jgi:hypothetical protein